MTDPGHPPSTIDRPEFDDLAVALSIELDRPVRELQPEVALSVAFPEALDRYRLHLVLDRWLPGFELPAQLDPADARLADVHHYLQCALAHREEPEF